MLLVFPFWWYGFFNLFSGTLFYDLIVFNLYNMCYTALPIVYFALYDHEFEYQELYDNFLCYEVGNKSQLLNNIIFVEWILLGVLQSWLITFASFEILESSNTVNGPMFFYNISGMVIFGLNVLVANLKIFVFSNAFYFIQLFFVFGSILFFVFNYAIISSNIVEEEIYHTFKQVFGNNLIWLVFILIFIGTTTIDLAVTRY